MALRDIKADKTTALVPAEAVSPSQGVYYPSLNMETQFVPALKGATLGQKVRMVLEGKLKAINDSFYRNSESGVTEENSDRTIEIHRVGVSKIAKALKG